MGSLLVLAVALAAPVDLSQLSGQERQAFQSIAAEEFCGCGSALTIAGCLEMRPDCRTGGHLGSIIARALRRGDQREMVLGFLSQAVMAPLCGPARSFKLATAPRAGSSKAPLTVVEFADFRCGHCRRMAPVVKQALRSYGKKVHFVFAPFPLGGNPESTAAAEASLAAEAQGKFVPMAELLFAHEGTYDLPALKELAKKAGLDVARFEKDLGSPAIKGAVQAIKQEGTEAGIQGTPTFFVNGRQFDFDSEIFTFADRFELELDRNLGSCQ